MPKEQIRKRGRRKPKNEDSGLPARGDFSAENGNQGSNFTSAPAEQSTSGAGTGGLHPSRAALLNGQAPPRYTASIPQNSHQTEAESGDPGHDEATLEWSKGPSTDPDYPFGILDPDIKAYFRNVEEQIKDWEGTSSSGEEGEDRKMFLTSVLSELRGHELQVATDPDTAIVLERLLPSMGDWGRRVIGDSFGGDSTGWEKLIRHRFGSHVVQTWFTLSADTLDREARGDYPPQQAEQPTVEGEVGVLPTMTTLFATLIEGLLPSLPSLLTNAHASPPLRLLLLIFTPNRALPALQESAQDGKGGLIRSKRSSKFRKGHGVEGKSFLGDEENDGPQDKGKAKAIERKVPDELCELLTKVYKDLLEKISDVEWRSMGVNPVGSAVVQLLLEIEVDQSSSLTPNSILDRLTEGLISTTPTETQVEAGPYLTSLQSSPSGTRLFEAILTFSPPDIFNQIWNIYFVGKIGKLASHPFANFVVARGVSRLDERGVKGVVRECKAVGGGKVLIKTSRTSVLQALVERATTLGQAQQEVLSLLKSALALPEDQTFQLVPCLMALKTYPIFQSLLKGETPLPDEEADIPSEIKDVTAEEAAMAQARFSAWQNRRNVKAKGGDLDPNMQGCLILQALVGLGGGVNEVVCDSLLAQPIDTLLEYAKSPIASHFLDSIFTTDTCPIKYKRRTMLAFMGKYKELAEDRMGSRVADTIWDHADGYMKEKIANSLVHSATALGNSQYGKYFARKLNLQLLARRPDEWKESMIGLKHHFAHQKAAAAAAAVLPAPMVTAIPPRKEMQGLSVEERPVEDTVISVSEEKAEKKEKRKKRKALEAGDDLMPDVIDELFESWEIKKKKKAKKDKTSIA